MLKMEWHHIFKMGEIAIFISLQIIPKNKQSTLFSTSFKMKKLGEIHLGK